MFGMRFMRAKKRAPNSRVCGFRSQYQASVSFMRCVSFRPRLCTSLMVISRPTRVWLRGRPKSLAALMALMVSPPPLASATTWALLAWAWRMNDEKSDAFSGCLMLPATVPPDAFTTSAVAVSSDWPNA
ncbi:hypothetical protein D3C72_1068780 [compost metagenome]